MIEDRKIKDDDEYWVGTFEINNRVLEKFRYTEGS